MTLRNYLHSGSIEEIKKKLAALYTNINYCNSCRLCQLPVNQTQRPPGKLGEFVLSPKKRILIVSQNPSCFRDNHIAHVWGGLDKLRDTSFLSGTFITNIIKCSFEDNIVPKDVDEIASICSKIWFKQELDILKPDRIIVLGTLAKKYVKNADFYFEHPSFAIRQGRAEEYLEKIIEAVLC